MNPNNYNSGGVAATFKVTHRLLLPSIYPHLRIKFNFSLEIKHLHYILDREYCPIPLFIKSCPSRKDCISATVNVGGSLSFVDVAAAVRHAVGNRLIDEECCRKLIRHAWEEVRKEFPAETLLPKHKTLDLRFDVEIKHRHVFVELEEEDEEAHVFVEEEEEEEKRRCCICLEEIAADGGGAEGMPCSHVFHGDCINEWLRRSRYCPVCRYAMQENRDVEID